ncbi:MAG: tRNA (guanosine(46)-N7)-methyltransferase TrmB [Bacteroidia bacterium]
MPNVVQYQFTDIASGPLQLRGKWNDEFFKNNHSLILELGCGKGEYTVGLAERFPEKNFIGIDIKGARMHRGAVKALNQQLHNAAFLRTRIDFINAAFAPKEVDEIWITFPDPQKEKERKRLTAPGFLKRYSKILKPGGKIHLKTDSLMLHEYTLEVIRNEGLHQEIANNDIYHTPETEGTVLREIKTTYEKIFLGEGKPITYVRFTLPEGYGDDAKIYPSF